MKQQVVFGFHAVTSRLRVRADSVKELFVDAKRIDKRMQDLIANAKERNVRVMQVDGVRIDGMTGHARHQGVVAVVEPTKLPQFVEDVLETIEGPPLLLLLDGVTDPHNLGACLRVADAAGVHAVIAPKDRSVGLIAGIFDSRNRPASRENGLARDSLPAAHRSCRKCSAIGGWASRANGMLRTMLTSGPPLKPSPTATDLLIAKGFPCTKTG